jgi:hypothetical protein
MNFTSLTPKTRVPKPLIVTYKKIGKIQKVKTKIIVTEVTVTTELQQRDESNSR